MATMEVVEARTRAPGTATNLYRPLAAGHIRVLKLIGTEARTTSDSQIVDVAIKCELEEVSLSVVRDGRRSYDALSYVWGHPARTRLVVCNGVEVSVTLNLFDALWQSTVDRSERNGLWVDALCINQQDNDERSSQVALMGQIYRSAARVVVWLGTGAASSADIAKAWDYIAARTQSVEEDDEDDEVDEGDDADADDADEDDEEDDEDEEEEESKEDEEAMDRLTEAGRLIGAFLGTCDWFDRLWTFQEIVLAQRAVLRMGCWEVPWDSISSLLRRGKTDGPLPQKVSWIEQAIHDSGASLLNLLELSQSRKSSVPHDRIYSLLGLYSGLGKLEVDYNLSLDVLNAQAAYVVIQELGQLTSILTRFRLRAAHPNYRGGTKSVAKSNAMGESGYVWALDWSSVPPFRVSELGHPLTWGPDIRCKLVQEHLVTDGVLLGYFIRYDEGQHEWLRDLIGRQEVFPPCVEKLEKGSTGDGEKEEHPSALDIYRQLARHDSHACYCPDGTTDRRSIHNKMSHSFHFTGSPRCACERIVWLCLLAGCALIVMLEPIYDETEATLRFLIAGTLTCEDGIGQKMRDINEPYFSEVVITDDDKDLQLNWIRTSFTLDGSSASTRRSYHCDGRLQQPPVLDEKKWWKKGSSGKLRQRFFKRG